MQRKLLFIFNWKFTAQRDSRSTSSLLPTRPFLPGRASCRFLLQKGVGRQGSPPSTAAAAAAAAAGSAACRRPPPPQRPQPHLNMCDLLSGWASFGRYFWLSVFVLNCILKYVVKCVEIKLIGQQSKPLKKWDLCQHQEEMNVHRFQ